ncbi:MAG: secretion activator protein [Xanthobacteraceae bacterium]|nr:MAG: secretion activator protein [Xanthobacteraceae bacterium]
MAARSWDEAVARVLACEGGYTDHPADPGGPTNRGITLADARRYWKRDATAADVKAMPVAVAHRIYRDRYWSALRCDELPAGLDYAMFDYGVNSGIARAGRVLRRLLQLSDRSAIVTAEVVAAAAARDPQALIAALCDERLAFLKSLRTWPVFGVGWGRRVAGARAAALAMARGAPAAAPQGGKTGAVVATTGAGAIVAAGAASAQADHAAIIFAVFAAIAVLAVAAMLVRR